jgi:DNA-directed RNA polymerase alpha subunit
MTTETDKVLSPLWREDAIVDSSIESLGERHNHLDEAEEMDLPERDDVLELPLDVLELPIRVYNALRRSGYTTVAHAIKICGNMDAFAVRNLGEKGLRILEERLRAFQEKLGQGFEFREQDPRLQEDRLTPEQDRSSSCPPDYQITDLTLADGGKADRAIG